MSAPVLAVLLIVSAAAAVLLMLLIVGGRRRAGPRPERDGGDTDMMTMLPMFAVMPVLGDDGRSDIADASGGDGGESDGGGGGD